MVPQRNRYRSRLSTVLIFSDVDRPMVRRRDMQSDRFLILDHQSVRAEIDPAAIGILGYHDAARSEVIAAVMGVPFGRGKLEQIDLRSHLTVLQHRASGSLLDRILRRSLFEADHFSLQARHQLLIAVDVAITEGQRQPLGVEHRAREDSETFVKTRNLVEQERRSPALAVDLGHQANLEIGLRSLDTLELS